MSVVKIVKRNSDSIELDLRMKLKTVRMMLIYEFAIARKNIIINSVALSTPCDKRNLPVHNKFIMYMHQ